MAIDHIEWSRAKQLGRRHRHPRTVLAPVVPIREPSGRSDLKQAVRRALVVLALVPLTLILAVKAAQLGTQVLVNIYGIGVLTSTIVIIYMAFSNYRDPSQDAVALTARPVVSCLLAVRDDVELIERCLRSLLEQTYGNVEVIVVDDVSSDGTRELLMHLQHTLPIRVLLLDENVGKKKALTHAALYATGDFFIFTDSDCVLEPDAVERCMLAFQEHPHLGALSGHARALNADKNLLTKMQDVWYDGQFGVSKAAESIFRSVTCVSGPMAAFRREAIYAHLPAWANDRFLGAEFKFATDRQLTGYVLRQRKWGIAYVHSARAWTQVPDTFGRMIRQQIRWKKSFIRNIFFTGRFYWRRGVYPSVIFYSHVVWVACAPLLAFRHLIWLPLHGQWFLVGLYLAGVTFKGSVWGIAYRIQNKGDYRWIYRPLMSLLSATVLSWLLVYSALTLRKSIWSRG